LLSALVDTSMRANYAAARLMCQASSAIAAGAIKKVVGLVLEALAGPRHVDYGIDDDDVSDRHAL